MRTTHYLTAAIAPWILLAAPVFAQDAPDTADDMKAIAGEVITSEDGTAVTAGESLIIKAPQSIITPTDGDKITEGHSSAKLYPKDVTTKPKMTQEQMKKAILEQNKMQPAPVQDMPAQSTPFQASPDLSAPAPVAVEIACPAGTTAQADGTCMITGDYQE